MRIALLLATAMLAAGCIDDSTAGTSMVNDAEQTPIYEATSPDGSIHFAGSIEACDDGYCIDALASNEGASDVHVSNICVSPFSEEMLQDGEPVHHREPMFHCEAFGTEPFEGGAQREYQSSWDGRVWDEEYQDAPAGSYTWKVTFRYWSDANGGNPHDLVLQFPVEIKA